MRCHSRRSSPVASRYRLGPGRQRRTQLGGREYLDVDRQNERIVDHELCVTGRNVDALIRQPHHDWRLRGRIVGEVETDGPGFEIEAGRRIPGLGHPVHKVEDPRTPRIYEIAEDTGLAGTYLARLREVSEAHARQTGRRLPVNGAGVTGAALADLGFQPALLRGFALLARTAGLLGHLAEEMQSPIGMRLYREVDERAKYVPPTGE